ncbi:MAG: Ser-Thr-rich GPI-anchored membrane family protein [Anaerotignum sp.]|nr:Ser-Thr-rich GPI-anchored membrane family protein [Anaerotignum sp.]
MQEAYGCAINKSYDITWGYSGNADQQVASSLLKDGTKIADLQTTTAGTGYYTWTPPATLKAGSGYQIQIQNLTISDVTLSGVFSIAVGGKVEVSEHLLPGDTVPLGQYHEAAKTYGMVEPMKNSNSCNMNMSDCWDFNFSSLGCCTDRGYYFQAKKGQLLELSGYIGDSTAKSCFAVVQTDSSGTATILDITSMHQGTARQYWAYTVPEDGVNIVL